jgi:TPR repeat protein
MMDERRTIGGSQSRGSEQHEKNPTVSDVDEIRARANKGDAEAQTTYGNMFASGRGISQDDAQAVAWFRKAAVQGNAFAQNALGTMYLNGRGVSQDYVQTVAWYRKAAVRNAFEPFWA